MGRFRLKTSESFLVQSIVLGLSVGVIIATTTRGAFLLLAAIAGSMFLVASRRLKPSVLLSGFALVVIDPFRVAQVFALEAQYASSAHKATLLLIILGCHMRFGTRLKGLEVGILLFFVFSCVFDLFGLIGAVPENKVTVIRAAVGFTLPILVLGVDWRNADPISILKTVSRIPLISLFLGLPLLLVGSQGYVVWDGSFPRLAGASIPAHLAMASLIGLISALWYFGKGFNRGAYWACLNFLLCVLTLTRGAVGAAILVVTGFVLWFNPRFVDDSHFHRIRNTVLRGKMRILAALSIALIASLQGFLGRSELAGGTIDTSGRLAAWDAFIKLAEQRLVSGYYLGFSTEAQGLVGAASFHRSFVAPHNEYIHFLLDLGLARFAILAALVTAWTVSHLKALPSGTKGFFVFVVVALLLYSSLDNLFSTPAGSVLLALVLAGMKLRTAASTIAEPFHSNRDLALVAG